MPESSSGERTGTLRALIQLARPFKRHFVFIAALALLGTGADLIQPLIYRVAINDVAGLFVHHPAPAAATDGRSSAATRRSGTPEVRQAPETSVQPGTTKLRHRRGFVAPRTSRETLTT